MPTVDRPGWHAHLELGFDRLGECTRLCHAAHAGPLRVQRPFFPEGSTHCHLYLLHPPGGLVGGDRLDVRVIVESGAAALITTPAAGKAYRSGGDTACQAVAARIAPEGVLEWLPQETIAFDGARLTASMCAELAPGACFTGWEILCFGRPACAERFTHGAVQSRVELLRDGRPLFLETGRYVAGSPIFAAAWGLGGQPVIGTLLATPCVAGIAARIREACTPDGPPRFAVTEVDDVLACRYLGPSAAEARMLFERAWAELRPALLGRPACRPRIWNT